MSSHHRERDDVDRHEPREKIEASDNPLAALRVIDQRFPPNATRDTVIDTRVAGVDYVASSCGHGVNLVGDSGWIESATFLRVS